MDVTRRDFAKSMSKRDWPQTDEPTQEVSTKEKQILEDLDLLKFFAQYSEGGVTTRYTNINESNIKSKVAEFMSKYPTLEVFETDGNPKKLFRYTREDVIEKFKRVVYGSEMTLEERGADTEEFAAPYAKHSLEVEDSGMPPQAPPVDFTNQTQSGAEVKPVEFKQNFLKICREIFDDPKLKNELKFILADFTDFKEGRDAIDMANILDLVNKFINRYNTLSKFEKEGNVEHFLSTLAAGDKKDKQANMAKQNKYRKVMMRFEDIMFGHHIER